MSEWGTELYNVNPMKSEAGLKGVSNSDSPYGPLQEK